MRIVRKLLIIPILQIMFGQLAAQTFQKEYDFGAQEELAGAIELPNGSSVFIGDYTQVFDNDFPFYNDGFLMKLDANGKFVSRVNISDFLPISLKLNHDTLSVFGIANLSNLASSKILFYDTSFTRLDSIEYKSNQKIVLPSVQSIRKNNGVLINLVTEIDPTNLNNRISKVLKYNTSTNNLVQNVTYDTTGKISNLVSGHILYSKQQNKYFLIQVGGYGSNPPTYGYSSIHRLDSAFKIEISRNLKTNFVDSFTRDTAFLQPRLYSVILANGNIAVSGIFNQLYLTKFLKGGAGKEIGLIIYDSNLNRLSSHSFATTDTADTPSKEALISDSNHIYLVNNKNWSNRDSYENKVTTTQLIKMDLNGNVISKRNYSNGKFTYIAGLLRTHDKGFLLWGSTYDSINNFSEGLNAYVLRLDSTGNLISGLNENKLRELNQNDILVYPNPATDVINFQKVNYFEAYQLSIYDVNGKEVERLSWNNDQKQISISDFASGIYFYRVQGKKTESFSGKFIKE